nr:helix-turn-helix domain-containing protein [Streptomyces sp. SID13726]
MRPHLLGVSEGKRRHVAVGSQVLRDVQRAGASRRHALFRRLRDDFQIEDLERAYLCLITFVSPTSGQVELVDGVLDTLVNLLGMHGFVAFVQGEDVVALVSSPREAAEALLEQLSAAARHTAEVHDVSVTAIGLGGALGSADGFDRSFRQAEFAAKVANRVPELNGRAWWESLGEYRLFSAVDWDPAGIASINQGVAALISERRIPLAATLLAYLEREGNVSATSDALNVHRTTLYYRIERARELLGEEPTGQSRFSIHAALRLADLAGLLAPAQRNC